VAKKTITKKPPTRATSPAPAAVAPADGKTRLLYVLSDSTGNLPHHMVAAFVTQFPPGSFEIRQRNFLQTDQEINEVMAQLASEPGLVLHAVVSPGHKQRITETCRRLALPCRDLTGDFVQFLADSTGVQPLSDRSRLHQTGSDYFGRITALEFTLEHDDGLGLDTLRDADVVLAGVSRTSKTPTSIYLAQLGFKVANVSLAMEVQPPAQLRQVRPGRGIGLVISPAHLTEIRIRRQESWQMERTSYSDPRHVAHEIAWSREVFDGLKWPVLDVTDQAVEETAGRILETLKIPRAPTSS
jgi:regulator of PEP synthase PpsR (kinase-PPPase family)